MNQLKILFFFHLGGGNGGGPGGGPGGNFDPLDDSGLFGPGGGNGGGPGGGRQWHWDVLCMCYTYDGRQMDQGNKLFDILTPELHIPLI